MTKSGDSMMPIEICMFLGMGELSTALFFVVGFTVVFAFLFNPTPDKIILIGATIMGP
jgi:hypothetical protein